MGNTKAERVRTSNVNRTGLGGRIRFLRNELKITQETLAEAIGDTCRGKQVCLWETGKNVPSATMLFEIARALGVTPNDLAPEGMFIKNDEIKEAVMMIDALEILDREAILRIVESLNGKQR